MSALSARKNKASSAARPCCCDNKLPTTNNASVAAIAARGDVAASGPVRTWGCCCCWPSSDKEQRWDCCCQWPCQGPSQLQRLSLPLVPLRPRAVAGVSCGSLKTTNSSARSAAVATFRKPLLVDSRCAWSAILEAELSGQLNLKCWGKKDIFQAKLPLRFNLWHLLYCTALI